MKRRILSSATAVCIVASLGMCAMASAKAGDRTFQQTYPAASALCARATAGQLPKRLEASQAQVIAACTSLQNAFGPLQATVQTATATFATGVASEHAMVKTACAPPRNRVACRAARTQAHIALIGLRATHRIAVRTYYISIEANRRVFWATIKSLRGGASIHPDAPIQPQSS